MTGKELAMALVGAALVGAAAGAATGVAVAPKERPEEQQTPDVADRLKAAEDALAATKTALEESRKSVAELSERVVKAEIATAKLAATPPVAVQPIRGGSRVVRRGAVGEKTGVEFGAIDVQGLPEAVTFELNDALDGLSGELAGADLQLTSLRGGLGLRKLPEAERWQKAKDDLGLTWNQVEDLKKAVADRDAAMKDANTVEKKTGPNGGTITISRPDAGKTAHAQAAYHDRVAATLNEEQKKSWQSKGYDHAFGKGGFGGAMVMAVDVNTERSGDAPKDGNK